MEAVAGDNALLGSSRKTLRSACFVNLVGDGDSHPSDIRCRFCGKRPYEMMLGSFKQQCQENFLRFTEIFADKKHQRISKQLFIVT